MAQKNIIRKIIANPLVQTFLVYLSGGWIALEMTDYFINKYELNTKISDILSLILLAGLPLAIFLSWYLGREKDNYVKELPDKENDKKSASLIRFMHTKPWFSIPGTVVLILLIITGARYLHRKEKIKWAMDEAIPQMQDLSEDWDFVNAFQLLEQVKKYIPDDPEFLRLDLFISREFSIMSDPIGAEVYYKEYSQVQEEWTLLGTTPLVNIEMPTWTLFRWKLEKQGYETVYAAAPTHMDTLFRTLHETGTLSEDMVYVEGVHPKTASDFLTEKKNDFYIDKHEVTNQMFKDFVDHGGYQNPAFWRNEFILLEDTLTFDEAMKHFKDITGRPGPSTWEGGHYPDGQDNYPVNGISWYEAAAYAVYANKSLPTLLQWQSAAGYLFRRFPQLYGSNVVPMSNMGGSGPEPAGSHAGISYFGAYDMAGNVREWCWNKSSKGRTILGGAWNDVSYMSTFLSQMPAFNRSAKNGFRCVINTDSGNNPEHSVQAATVTASIRDYNLEEPIPESEFQIYKRLFQYDKAELNSKIEERYDSQDDWIIEKISFDAAYESERMLAYLFLPRRAVAPYQTVIVYPGAYARNEDSIMSSGSTNWMIDYLLKNGKAVMFPNYYGTFERKDKSCGGSFSDESHRLTECLVKWVKDFSRSIDYLETRTDIDTANLGYLGDSWGGMMGAIIPAVETRLKLSVLIRGGLPSGKQFPEADHINYVPQVKIPVLMLNGRYDFTFPLETAVQPMFDFLGTPEEHKKMLLYETDHHVPKSEIIKETLNWMDTYFDPENKKGQPQ